MVHFKTGNIFNSTCMTLVVPTNTIGPMGAGIAVQFRDRFIGLETMYKKRCTHGCTKVGHVWLWQGDSQFNVLTLPTKEHWKNPSEIQYVRDGLQDFVDRYEELGITTIAFPMLGTGLGGLSRDVVLGLMTSMLQPLPIYIEIYV